ncbi:hypothetical protein JW859_05530 [bacterium]|nr:hypothetical protein [bacterium]
MKTKLTALALLTIATLAALWYIFSKLTQTANPVPGGALIGESTVIPTHYKIGFGVIVIAVVIASAACAYLIRRNTGE